MTRAAQKQVKPTYAQIRQQLATLQALQVSTLRSVVCNLILDKLGASKLMTSACIVTITDTAGAAIVPPFGIRDGLSHETLQALRDDVRKSIALAQL